MFHLPERLEDEAQMLSVAEMPEESHTMELVLPVLVIESFEVLQLLHTSFVPVGGVKSRPVNNTCLDVYSNL